jgi:hypothetical protein
MEAKIFSSSLSHISNESGPINSRPQEHEEKGKEKRTYFIVQE